MTYSIDLARNIFYSGKPEYAFAVLHPFWLDLAVTVGFFLVFTSSGRSCSSAPTATASRTRIRRRRRATMPRMADGPSIRSRLARRFDPAELRAIKKLWVRHSIAEDARDIDGLIATLAPDCVYEIVPTGQRWEGHAGARAFYTELFGGVPRQPVRADRDRRRAAGRVRGRRR